MAARRYADPWGTSRHHNPIIESSSASNGTKPDSWNYSALRLASYDSQIQSGSTTGGTKAAVGPATNAPRIRRRNRGINSCLECRRRKLKCDKQAPCNNCGRFQRDCLYLAPAADSRTQHKLAELKEKMGALEKGLEQEISAAEHKARADGSMTTHKGVSEAQESPDSAGTNTNGQGEQQLDEEDDDLEPTALAALDSVYDDSIDDQELMDLGVQMGKMRISERIGGWVRPKLVDELNDTLTDVQAVKGNDLVLPEMYNQRTPQMSQAKLQAASKSYIGPGPEYLAPSSSFFFPGTNMSTTLLDYLPGKNIADQLVSQYWTAVHHMCKTVHKPTFEAQYAMFWAQISTGQEPVAPIQAIVFAAMFSAVVSMTDEQIVHRFQVSRASLVDSLRSGTEYALAKANFMRTTRIDTMQALVMYLIPMLRAEVSRAHSALVGAAIRLAECMGLHRDGSLYNMSLVEVQVRRMIWHQLCILDFRSCEAVGPRPQVRIDDYDTKMPCNVNDEELMNSDGAMLDERIIWTDMTFMRIRAEGVQMRRQIWYDMLALDKKKKSLTAILLKIQKWRTTMDDKFLRMIDDSIPLHRVARLSYRILISSFHLMVLHRYLFSSTQRMPDRLRQVLIEAGVSIMESSIELDTLPALSEWSWYRGALHQYHAALLLLMEVYAYPMRKEAARIWKCLDYVFQLPTHLAPKQKAELVLTDLRDRMTDYHQMRKYKISKQMAERTQAGSSFYSGSNAMADSLSRIPQTFSADNNIPIFSSPSLVHNDLSPSDSTDRPGSVPNDPLGNGQDMSTSMMEDINWAECEKAFNPEVYTGDLNIPDFDMTDFTGNFATAQTDPNLYDVQAAQNIYDFGMTQSKAFGILDPSELADVTFLPSTFVPAPTWYSAPGT